MLIAQSGREAQAGEGLFWIVIIVVLSSVGAMLMRHVIKRWRSSLDDAAPDFTLAQLREMRDQGELTIAEYDALKEKIVSSTMY